MDIHATGGLKGGLVVEEKNDKKYDEIQKDVLIKKEIQKLKRVYKNIPADKKQVVYGLIENAAYIYVTLKEVQQAINEAGVVEVYRNSETQWGTKKSPAVDAYNNLLKNYIAIIKQLTDLLPKKETQAQTKDEFADFILKANPLEER